MWKFWQRWFERRDIKTPGFASVADLLGVQATAAGITVTPDTALQAPAVFAAIDTIARDVAKAPIKLRRKIAADTFEDAIEHDLYEILHALPNPETTAYQFKHALVFDLLTHERAYAEVVRVDGRVMALWRLDPARVTVDRDGARRKRWTYRQGSETHVWLFDASMPPVLELAHPSPLRHCRDLVATAIALQRYVGRFFSNGARPSGVLTTDTELDPDQAKDIRESFSKWHAGVDNAHRVAVLEHGLKYQAIAPPNDAAQLNETLATIRAEIAGVFHLPLWKLGDLSKATYSNMAAGAEEYVNSTLDPLFTCIEHAIRRDLLTTRQYGRFDVTFDRSALIRSDVKSLHDALAVGRQNGFYSANDIRRKLGENPIPGGDAYLVNSALVPIAQAGGGRE